MEMVSAILFQLTRNLTPEQIKEGGFDAYFVDHTTGIYPQSAAGVPWSAATFQSKGDPITDLFEDMAADAATRYVQSTLLSETLQRSELPVNLDRNLVCSFCPLADHHMVDHAVHHFSR